jgi:hypothetical protein
MTLIPLVAIAKQSAEEDNSLKYFQTPMHEIIQNELYLGMTQFGEYAVTYSGKGGDLKVALLFLSCFVDLSYQTNDLLTHVDHLKLLNGNLQDFLDSGAKETVVPIVDDEDVRFGGSRLLGFVLIQAIVPRKLHLRRGDLTFDLEEGGPAPMISVGNVMIGKNGEVNSHAEEYVPPPVGGGRCISARDCYSFNGTCSPTGECQCRQNRTGSYCQLVVSQATGVAGMISQQKNKMSGSSQEGLRKQPPENPPNLPKPPPEVDTFVKIDAAAETKPKAPAVANFRLERKSDSEGDPSTASGSGEGEGTAGDESLTGKKGKGVIRKKKPSPKGPPAAQDSNTPPKAAPGDPQQSPPPQPSQETESPEAKMQVLYGPNGVYPEPYLAGKIAGPLAHQRAKLRAQPGPTPFIYSVRYRTGPIGIAFDNKQPSASIVESALPNYQSAISDVQKGDRLIAINEINTTTAPAKVVTRILQSLSWPIVLVFQCPPPTIDSKLLEAQSASKRTVNMTIIYPPSMLGEYQIRLADWTPPLELDHEDSCTFYSIRVPTDVFGCKVNPNECKVSSETDDILSLTNGGGGGKFSEALERYSPIQVLLAEEAARKHLTLRAKTLSLLKRGTCTFVEKAKGIVTSGANLGVVINTDDTVMDIPAGKENITACTAPYGIMRAGAGELLHIAALQSEVLVLVSDPIYGQSPACASLQLVAEDVLDRWAHSVPPVALQRVLSTPSPRKDNLRGRADEGGRIAISGQNGWAFFDYHLALFGPQEVPLGPHRLQMAMPPHG